MVAQGPEPEVQQSDHPSPALQTRLVYDAYVGEYELEPGLVTAVTTEFNRFFIQVMRQKAGGKVS